MSSWKPSVQSTAVVALLSLLFVVLAACGGTTDDNFDPIDVPDVDIPDADLPDVDDTDVNDEDPIEPVLCDDPIPAPPSGQRCTVTPGSSDYLLIRGTILAGDEIYEEGGVLIDDQSPNRVIECVGCDCAEEAAAVDATIIECAEGVISPGLINPHDHLTFAEGRPQLHGEDRFDHRHDWRRGLRGHDQVSTWPRTGGSREVVLYGELRMLFGGATSIAGSTGFVNASGLLRNLDNAMDTEGLQTIDVDYRTFPLGDGGNVVYLQSGCGYPNIDSESRLEEGIYLPHISEGIDLEAQNEMHCLFGNGTNNLIRENTSIIHGIAVDARDVARIADRGANLVWSPRTNIDLYGNTAPVTLYHRFGVPISLGTDWSTSGSMNMLRELQCADYLNRLHFNQTFTDQEIWKMATYNAAISMGAEHKLGLVYPGYVADITIFDGTGRYPYRAIIDAEIDDITLVMRGGEPLYGDAELIEALVGEDEVDQCEVIDMCDRDRRACIELDTGHTLAELTNGVHSASYPLFFCGEPEDEPTCVPSRPSEYSGIADATDRSGDGIPDSMDNCPDYFNPIRPMDGATQGDTNGNGIGDVCDPCPLSEDPNCTYIDFNDWSGDGIPNDEDVCPFHFNPNQTDSSGDGIGDACHPCPEHFLEPGSPCPGNIYDVKTGTIGAGEGIALNDVLVTAAEPGIGIFMQVHPDDDHYDGVEYSGLYAYLANSPGVSSENFPAPGDRIDATGYISDFFGQLQLVNVSELEILSSGNPLPAPYVVDAAEAATGGSLQQALEGALITVEDVLVTDTDVPPGPGDSAPTNEYIVDDSLHVNNFFYLTEPFPQVGDTIQSITGVIRWANGNNKLEPRFADDVILAPPALEFFDPEFVYLDVADGLQPALELHLDRAAEETMNVSLSYGDASALGGPDTVVFQPGQTSQTLEIEALEVRDQPISVIATHDESSATAYVRTFDADTERVLESVSAERVGYFAGEIFNLDVALNVPAGASGDTATLEILPDSSSIVYDTTIDFAPGQRVVNHTIELGTDLGVFAAFVDYGEQSMTYAFQVFESPQTYVETFSNFQTSGSSYVDGTFVGDAGFEWQYESAREGPVGTDAPEIDGTGMIFRYDTSRVYADEIPGGISSFSLDISPAFTNTNPRQVELFINGESRGTSQVIGTNSDDHGEVFEFVVDDLDVAGDFDLEVRSTTNNQITIDNLSWTSGYDVDPDDLDLETPELDHLTPTYTYIEPSPDLESTLTLHLSGPALQEMTIDLAYGDADVIEGPDGDQVAIAVGQSSVEIPLRGLQPSPDPIAVDATFEGQTVTAWVRVDDVARHITSFNTCQAVLVDAAATVSVELDEPAGADGFNLPVHISSPDLLAAPGPEVLAFAAGETTADLVLEFGSDTGTTDITVHTGSDEATLSFEIFDLEFPIVEDFDTLPSTGGSYAESGSYYGAHDIYWEFGGIIQLSATHSLTIGDTPSLLFGSDNPSFLRTGALPGGISSFSLDMRKAYSGDGERQLELLVNDSVVATSQAFGDFSGEDDTILQFEADDINIECVHSLEIRSVNTSNQLIIDNVTWNSYQP